MTNFPKKCWYVAATCGELGRAPVGRRLLGKDVVLWRGADGRVAAFENRCAHRGFPLDRGRIEGQTLVCGYHGCTYDRDGCCRYTPAQAQAPVDMRVTVYPVREDPPFVWIWLGPPAAAATVEPPATPWIDEPFWTTFGNSWRVRANYMMVHEHLLDFSYAPVVHAGDVPSGLDRMPAFSQVEVTETTVSYLRRIPGMPLTDWQRRATGLDPNLRYDHSESGTFVSPAMHRQYWAVEGPDGRQYVTTRTHAITPETEESSHVFMQSSRNYRLDDSEVTAVLRMFLDRVVARDIEVLEMVGAHSGYDGWRGGVEFQSDAAAARARRIVGVMLAREAGRAPIRPGFAPTQRGYARGARRRGPPPSAS